MIHYIYKIIDVDTNEFYIGKRSTDKYKNFYEDPYKGSGLWIRSKTKIEKSNLRKELLEYCNDLSSLNLCEIKHIQNAYHNTLNKNLSYGGDGTLPGKLNFRYLDEKHHWYNIETKEEIICSQYDFRKICNMYYQSINDVVNGRHKRLGDWTLFEYKNLKMFTRKNKKFIWINKNTNEKFVGSQKEFSKKYNISIGMVSMMVNGNRKSKYWNIERIHKCQI